MAAAGRGHEDVTRSAGNECRRRRPGIGVVCCHDDCVYVGRNKGSSATADERDKTLRCYRKHVTVPEGQVDDSRGRLSTTNDMTFVCVVRKTEVE